MKIQNLILIAILFVMALLGYLAYGLKSETFLTNPSSTTNQLPVFPQPSSSLLPIPQGMQIVKSLLGLEVKFLNGHVDYAGLSIMNDPRYQALDSHEKLVDAIQFQPAQSPAYFLLIAIAKGPNGVPIIVPGKFDLMAKTEKGGLVLNDIHGRLFYYSGYILSSAIWQSLAPGQSIQDKSCRAPILLPFCPSNKVINVVLKKPLDPHKDVPFLTLIPN